MSRVSCAKGDLVLEVLLVLGSVCRMMVSPSSFRKVEVIYAYPGISKVRTPLRMFSLLKHSSSTPQRGCWCSSETDVPQSPKQLSPGSQYAVITNNLVRPFLNRGLGYLLRNAKHGFLAYLEKKIFPFSN